MLRFLSGSLDRDTLSMLGKERERCLPTRLRLFAPHVVRCVRDHHSLPIQQQRLKLAINELMDIKSLLPT